MDLDIEQNSDYKNEETKRIIKLSGSEYEKLKTKIIHIVKEFESVDKIPKNRDIIEYYIENELENLEEESQATEMISKLNGVINKLIYDEGILIVVNQNIENDDDREISLNIDYGAYIG